MSLRPVFVAGAGLIDVTRNVSNLTLEGMAARALALALADVRWDDACFKADVVQAGIAKEAARDRVQALDVVRGVRWMTVVLINF